MLPSLMSAIAASMAFMPEFDLGLVATNITASARGIRASGIPTINAASMADLTMGIICG